jgi:metal-sulfur cluster biosynthetic enzyme
LVNDVEVDGTAVAIELLPTTPMCMYMTQIIDEAVMEVEKLGGVESVEVEQNVEDMWRPDRMSEELRDAREQRLGPELRNEPEPP